MLIRETGEGRYECITQQQHAFVSGVLAGAWTATRLSARLIQANALHDAPWRRPDAAPTLDPETGRPHDFISYPMDDKVRFYREGIDELEEVDPYVAYLVSLHYTSFAGTRDHEPLTEPEARRRERLAVLTPETSAEEYEAALSWVQFFDILSLYICLTGPKGLADSVPRWLRGDGWKTAPDGEELSLRWRDDSTLVVDPWPLVGAELSANLRMRVFGMQFDDEQALRKAWKNAVPEIRPIRLLDASTPAG